MFPTNYTPVAPTKKKSSPLFLIILISMLVLGGGVGTGYYLVTSGFFQQRSIAALFPKPTPLVNRPAPTTLPKKPTPTPLLKTVTPGPTSILPTGSKTLSPTPFLGEFSSGAKAQEISPTVALSVTPTPTEVVLAQLQPTTYVTTTLSSTSTPTPFATSVSASSSAQLPSAGSENGVFLMILSIILFTTFFLVF